MNLDRDFWKGKKVFLTGDSGFKGGWLSVLLKYLDADIYGFSLPPLDQSFYNKVHLGSVISHKDGDIRNAEDLLYSEKEFAPDILIHMAAQPLVIRSYKDPVETFSTNVMGTVNTLELIRESNSINAGVIITTDKCYENKNLTRGYTEEDPMGGHDPYSSSKGSAELIISSYQRSFFSKEDYKQTHKAIGAVRAGNVIGGGDYSENRLIPDFIRSIDLQEPVEIRNPSATRPWQHVLEPLVGYLMVAEKLYKEGPSESDCWNFGPKIEDIVSVSEVADLFCNTWGEGLAWNLGEAPVYHEAKNLSLDINKAQATLGWKPKWGLNQTIDKIVEWYKKDINGLNALDSTFLQIEEYLNQ